MKRRRGPSSVVLGSATIVLTVPSLPTSAPQHSCGYVCWPCSRIAVSTAEEIVSCWLLIESPEAVVQVLLRAVRKHRNDNAALQTPRDIEHRRHRRSGRDAGEQPFFPRQPAHHAIGSLRIHAQVLVRKRRVVNRRHDRRLHVLQSLEPVERTLR